MVGDSFERGDLAFPESLPASKSCSRMTRLALRIWKLRPLYGNRLFTAHFVLTEANAAGAAHDNARPLYFKESDIPEPLCDGSLKSWSRKGSWNSPTRTLCVKWRRYNEQR
jgi:hypothetical protein